MERLVQLYELSNAQKEYKHYFNECELVFKGTDANVSHVDTDINHPKLNHLVISVADDTWEVTVDISGWYQIGQSDRYATFELLMTAIHPPFIQKFNEQLFARLTQLQDQQ